MENCMAAARAACGTVSTLLICWVHEMRESTTTTPTAQQGSRVAINAEKPLKVGVSSFHHPCCHSIKGTAAPFSELKIISNVCRTAFRAVHVPSSPSYSVVQGTGTRCFPFSTSLLARTCLPRQNECLQAAACHCLDLGQVLQTGAGFLVPKSWSVYLQLKLGFSK